MIFIILLAILIILSDSIIYAQRAEFFGDRLGTRAVAQVGHVTIQNILQYIKFAQRKRKLIYEFDFIYGISKNLSTKWEFPFFLKNQNVLGQNSSGISDILIELSWTYFSAGPNRASFTPGMVFPTGDPTKIPKTGLGSFGYVLEGAFVHGSDKWHFSFTLENILFMKFKGRKPGNQYLFEYILAKPIKIDEHSGIFVGVDLFGSFAKQDENKGVIDITTGGTLIFFGPLVSYKRNNATFQIGFQGPIAQNLQGIQPAVAYLAFANLRITF